MPVEVAERARQLAREVHDELSPDGTRLATGSDNMAQVLALERSMHQDELIQSDVLIQAGALSTHADEMASAFRGPGVAYSTRSSVLKVIGQEDISGVNNRFMSGEASAHSGGSGGP